MPRAQAFIPLSKGIDQKLDDRLREPESLAQATNAYYRRNNGLTKRHGFTPLTSSGYTHDGPSKGLLSTGDELLIRGYRRLWAYNESNALVNPQWLSKGDVSPFTGQQRTVFSDALSIPSSDSCHSGGYTVHAATTLRFAGSLPGGGTATSLVYKVETEQGANEIKSTTTIVSDPGTNIEIGAARTVAGSAAAGASVVHIGCARYATTALQWYRWSSATPTTTPALAISHLDLYTLALGDSGNDRHYDATSLGSWPTGASGQWAYCYVKLNPIGSRTIYVARMFDGVTIASWLIPSPVGQEWEYCAIADGPIAGQIYVVGTDTASNTYLYAYTQNGALNWSKLMHAASTGTVHGCSVVEGTQGGSNLVLVATNNGNVGLPQRYSLDMSATDPTGVSLSTRTVTRNMYAFSKPWNAGGRFYIVGRVRYGQGNTVGQLNYDNGYCAEVIFDVFSSATTANLPQPQLVGRYDFGVVPSYSAQTPSQEWTFTRGSMQTVQQGMTYTSGYRYATQRIVNRVPFKFPTFAGDFAELDFAGKCTQVATTRGSATLGGANVAWYTGQSVYELGFSSGPVIATITSANDAAATLIGGQTYTYVGVLESYDEKGNLTRSVPGPPCAYTIPGGPGNHHIDVTFYTIGASERYSSQKRFAVVLYRADQDGVFQRCTQPFVNSFDDQTSQYFPIIRDMGEQYDAIYTQSGAEVEASGPDGAAFVMVGTKRVWLAGFFRRDRIQYSKLYNPTTANECAIAPEFNDAFSYLLPGGDPVTGLGELDDKLIVFTKSKIFAIAGNGPDDGGRGNDFSGLQLVASDTGCIDARSIVATPAGIFFQTFAGIFVLGRDLQLNFAGSAVRDITDAYTECTSAVLVPKDSHVRFTLRNGENGLVLVYDFDQGAWSRWDVKRIVGPAQIVLDPVGACLHKDVYHVLASDGRVYKEDASTYFDHNTIYIPMKIETGWLQAAQQSGWQRIRQVAALCKANNPHSLTLSLYQEFDGVTPTQTYTWTEATLGAQKLQELEVMRVKQQKCTAFKVLIEDASSAGTTTGQGYDCSGFSVELSGKRGLYKPGTQQRN